MSEAPENIEAWFAELLHRHLAEQLAPMIMAINQLVAQLVEQLDARERLARRYLEDNAELRQVARLAENVRNATPTDATQVN